MKKIYLAFCFAITFILGNSPISIAQCPFSANSFDMGTLNITTTQQQKNALNGDYYLMSLSVDDTIIIQSVNLNIEITLWDASQSAISSSNTGDLQEIISQTGNYYVHFSDASCTEDGSPLDDFTYIILHQIGGGTGGDISLTSSYGTGYFIEGVTGVNNAFTATGPPSGADHASFNIRNSSGAVISTSSDNNGSDGWAADLDMGDANNGSYVTVDFYNSSNVFLDSAGYSLDVIDKPNWLNTGSVSNVSVLNNEITMDCSYPIYDYDDVITGVKGLNGKHFGVNSSVTLTSVFNMQNRTSTTSGNKAEIILNTLGQDISAKTIDFADNAITFDNNYNMAVIVSDSISTPKYEVNFPALQFPVAPAVTIKIDAGIGFYATLKGQIVIGQNGSDWGFVDVSGQQTKVVAKVVGTGFVRAGISILAGLASASGSLEVTGRIGGGFQYVSLPSPLMTPIFGGDINVSGKVVAKLFWGLGTKEYESGSLYYGNFGDIAAINKVSQTFDQRFGSSSITYKRNATLMIPDNNPQPTLATRGTELYSSWIENDGDNGWLLFSKINSAGTAFSEEKIVYSDNKPISNPKVGIMSSGSAIITWTQNRYSNATLPINADENDLIQAQDVWAGIYDNAVDSIVATFQLGDDNSTLSSGRAEGEAKVTMGNGTEGLITWVAQDPAASTTDIWYTHVDEQATQWVFSAPTKLANTAGVSKDVNVSYVDNVNAIATWINDPDGIDSTLDNEILFAEWNGSIWGAPQVLASNDGSTSFDELSVDYNDNKCAVAWTSTLYDNFGAIIKRLDMQVWNASLGDWDASSAFFDEDSLYFFQKPRLSISDNGLASICYQVVEMFADTNNIDAGQLYLYLKDLNNTSGSWVENTNNPYICDPNAYIWELDAGFGNGNNFYTLTQEYNESTGVVTSPVNGILFGDPNLSMVLRGLVVNSNLTLSDIPEPTDVPTGIIKTNKANYGFNFELKQNVPNPFSDKTSIEYRIMKDGFVKLEVRDITGFLVTTITNEKLPAGNYKTIFDAGNLSSGIYLCSLNFNGNTITKKMTIAK